MPRDHCECSAQAGGLWSCPSAAEPGIQPSSRAQPAAAQKGRTLHHLSWAAAAWPLPVSPGLTEGPFLAPLREPLNQRPVPGALWWCTDTSKRAFIERCCLLTGSAAEWQVRGG